VKVLIAGAGGVGGYFGARLAELGHEVWFLARGEHLRALRSEGLTVRSDLGDVRLERVRAVEDGAEAGPVEAVLFCVKTYDNEVAADAAAGAIGPGTAICSLQNGVENEEFLARRFPQATVLGGVARIEAWREGPGLVVQRGRWADAVVGAFRRADRPAAQALAEAFGGGPVPVTISEDIRADLWLKLLVIAGVGGVTAYCRCPIGAVLADPRLRDLATGAFTETEAVARAFGIAIPPDPVGRVVRSLERSFSPDAKSSMCRDVEAGRPLEVEAINGAVVRFGERAGVPTPATLEIYRTLLPLHRQAMAARAAPADRGKARGARDAG
jgi:2-dehydropantoate 2-reductase